jgi:hypothetical protein
MRVLAITGNHDGGVYGEEDGFFIYKNDWYEERLEIETLERILHSSDPQMAALLAGVKYGGNHLDWYKFLSGRTDIKPEPLKYPPF